jgi:MFS family permease
MPLYGRLADVLGRKKVVLFAILLFTAGSVLAAGSHSMIQLICFRGLQGLGAGGIMPVVLTILGDIFTLEERARIQGVFSAVWGLSSLAGPALGAFLIHTPFGWRSVFLVNLPFGVLGMAVLLWKYHDKQKPHSTVLDLPGIALLSIGSMALLALVSRLGPDGWGWPMIVGLVAVTVVSIGWFVHHERRTDNPVLSPDLMLRREIGPSILGTFFFGAVFLSLDTFVPLYVQGGRGGGATGAAAVVTPVMLTWAISGMVAAPLLIRWGFRRTALLGCCLIVTGFTGLLLAALLGWPNWVLTAVLAITGMGFGPVSMSQLLSAQDAVEWQQRGIITSSISFFRTIGGALGIGLLGAAFNFLSRGDLQRLKDTGISPAAALDPDMQKGLSPESLALIHHAISGGLLWVFGTIVALTVVLLGVTSLMRDKKPDHAVGKMEAFDAGIA